MFRLTTKEVRLLAAIVLVLATGGLVKTLRTALTPPPGQTSATPAQSASSF